jgi:hypothetical protein
MILVGIPAPVLSPFKIKHFTLPPALSPLFPQGYVAPFYKEKNALAKLDG